MQAISKCLIQLFLDGFNYLGMAMPNIETIAPEEASDIGFPVDFKIKHLGNEKLEFVISSLIEKVGIGRLGRLRHFYNSIFKRRNSPPTQKAFSRS